MTKQKTFKRRVRARMDKTGESYATARLNLLPKRAAAAAPPTGAEPAWQPRFSDDAVSKATGRTWAQWFALLDSWHATDHTHTEIARWLVHEHAVSRWWAQSLSAGYEQARGMREAHQQSDGAFAAHATKTITASEAAVRAAFTDEKLRGQWLSDARWTPHASSRPGKPVRAAWADDTSKIEVVITAKGPNKTQTALSHVGLADSAAVPAMKAYWRERLQILKALLEGS